MLDLLHRLDKCLERSNGNYDTVIFTSRKYIDTIVSYISSSYEEFDLPGLLVLYKDLGGAYKLVRYKESGSFEVSDFDKRKFQDYYIGSGDWYEIF